MAVTWIGYLGGVTKDVLAILVLAGTAVAVTAFFTFLPWFLFILAGRPLVEARRGQIRHDPGP